MTPEQFEAKKEKASLRAKKFEEKNKNAWMNKYHPDMLRTPLKPI